MNIRVFLRHFYQFLLKKNKNNLSLEIIHGSVWTFITQIFTRLLTFARTIILARLLSPHDFGLMGIAFLALSALQTFSETGVNAALIYKKENTRDDLCVAWTVRLLRSVLIAVLLFVFAPQISSFFNNNEVINIIRLIAIGQLFYGFSNIAIIRFQKEIEFHKYFLFSICSVLPEVIIAIWLAILLKSVWALVAGYLVGSFSYCIFSYVFCPFVPRFSLSGVHLKSLLKYGKWIWASTIIIFLITQGDDIFVGKFLGTAALGMYQLAYRISNLPATEIVHVISRVAFPAYVKLRENLSKLAVMYLNFLRFSTLIAFSISFLLLSLSYPFVFYVLGGKWINIINSMRVLCIFACLRSIGVLNGSLFRALGYPDFETKLSLMKLLLMAVFIYPLGIKYGIVGVALSTTLPSFFHNFYGLYLVAKKINVGFSVFCKVILVSFLVALFCLIFSKFSFSFIHFLTQKHLLSLFFSAIIGLIPLGLFLYLFLLKRSFYGRVCLKYW